MISKPRFRITLALTAALFASFTGLAYAQDSSEQPKCGWEVKAEIANALSAVSDPSQALALQAELYEKYKKCAGDSTGRPSARSFCGKLSYAGSLYFESMPCCGYDPQRKLFACPVEIRQPIGFGGAPFPGSSEYVLTCVDMGAGLEPVASDDVHLADAVSGQPYWYFNVTARASRAFSSLLLDGKTYRARSILSWGLSPGNDCSYQPIWGNAIDYQIRLDP